MSDYNYTIDFAYISDDITYFFSQIWRLYTGWTIPIIGISPAGLVVSMMTMSLVLFIIKNLLGMSTDVNLSVGNAINERKRKKTKAAKTKKRG